MTSHQSSVSVASVLTAVAVLAFGYRFGRTHAAWRHVRSAKRAVAVNRRHAWGHTIRMLVSLVAVLATIGAAAFEAAR